MSRYVLILLLVLLASCSTHVKVVPLKCNDDIMLYTNRPGIPFHIEKRLYFPKGRWAENRFSVNSILAENDISCSDLISISYTFKDDAFDVVYNMLPLSSTKTIVIEGLTVDPESLTDIDSMD